MFPCLYESFKYDELECLQNVYLGFLIYGTSGQVATSPLPKSMGKKGIFTLGKHIWLESLVTVVDNSVAKFALPTKVFEVTRGQNRHLPITFDQKEIETRELSVSVRSGQANLICNMTHFGHHVTLAWLDLRSNFDIDLSKSFYIGSTRLTRQTRWYQMRCSTFKINVLLKTRFGKFWNFVWPQFWPEPKNDRYRNGASFRTCLSFFSTVPCSRDHGGAR